MRLTLGLPPRELNPNVRVHWARKARVVKYYREIAFIAARNIAEVRKNPRWREAQVWTTFYLPDRRRRDGTNLMAAMKPAWDGLVDAGLLADDDKLHAHAPTLLVDAERPRVEITIEPMTEAAA